MARAAGRIAYPVRLAAARLRRRAGRMLLVGGGIALAAAVLAVVDAGSLVIRARSLEQAAAALPASQRAVQATWFGTLGTGDGDWNRLDAIVRPRLATLGREPISAMLYREAQIEGHLVDLRAVDGAGRYVKLVSGRLPRPCTPARCEVLRIDGAGPIPSTPRLRLVEVGRATIPAGAAFRDFLGRPPADTSVLSAAIQYHTPPRAPLVLAEGVRGLSRTQELSNFFRSYAWFVPLAPSSIHPWTVDELRAKIDRLRSEIGSQSSDQTQFDLTAPTDALAAAAGDGKAAGRRLLLLGGEAVALLLAFTVLAAATLRRDAEAARNRLTWLGARRWQLALLSLAELGTVAVLATLAGWLAGSAVAAGVARRAGLPAVETAAHSVFSLAGIGVAALLAAAAALLLTAAVRAPAARIGGSTLTPLDVAALGALAAIAVGLARGDADAAALAGSGGTGGFLLLLPGLVAFVAAVAAARLLAPALRALGRGGRRGPLPARLAALSLARNPGHATAAVAFLVVSLGLALFAAAYRSTLVAGRHDQAAYAVPADYVLSEDLAQLVPVTHVPRPPGDSFPVLRQSGDVSRLESSSGADVLGIPAGRLAALDGWRSDFSDRAPGQLAAAIRPAAPVALRTEPLPAGARRLSVDVAGRGDPILVRAAVRLRNGDWATVALGATPADGRATLSAPLPAGAERLLGLSFALRNNGRLTANAGTGLQPTAEGTVELRGIRGLEPDWSRWTGIGGVAVNGSRLRYALTTDVESGFRLRQATDGGDVPAIVSPALARAAGEDGLLPFDVAGERITLRVAAVASRFPGTTQADFVVADEGTLSTALESRLPGLGTPNELWLNAPASAAARLARPPYDLLSVRSRRAVEHRLEASPLARGTLLVLAGTALVALLLAVVGLLLGLVGDLRDEGGELFDLESQGVEPRQLRRHLRLRTAAVALAGAVGGVATGAILASLVLDLVQVTAELAAPQPPLALRLDWTAVALATLATAGIALAAVAVATAIGFRSRAAGRFREAGA